MLLRVIGRLHEWRMLVTVDIATIHGYVSTNCERCDCRYYMSEHKKSTEEIQVEIHFLQINEHFI